MNKKISVVIPTFNEENYIEKCLTSLLNQTLERDEYEIIVVDGGSEDRTIKIAEKYADTVIFQRSEGVGGARNDGVMESNSKIIATTDADIILPPDWLERIFFNFSSRDIVALFGPIIPIENRFKYRFLISLFNDCVHFLAKVSVFYATVGSNTAFRKDCFLKVGGYPEVPAGEDYGVAFRLKKLGRIYYDPKLRVHFSMRRMEKYGVISSLYNWTVNVLVARFKLNDKINVKEYTRQKY
ncbi:MAG TPA: glycosyltransferase [Archaeoglobaceae archaeon]|nr:glycosyltransferase [Archaeoglobaceae archaeon]